MSATPTVKNEFLPKLLALQQDGKGAISAPNNWKEPPLLEVETETDQTIDRLQRGILLGTSQNRTACWHFFVGSPGNGKSTATGKLCRKLVGENNCRICDPDGVEIGDPDVSELPYDLYVYENGNKFPSALIVQDASVVRKPFDKRADPADDLIEMLCRAWTKGISLIVCTNRGVLENAQVKVSTHSDAVPWRTILKAVVDEKTEKEYDRPTDGKKRGFKRVKVSQQPLDNISLLRGNGKAFFDLAELATQEDRWEECNRCPALGSCPFKSNRDWLKYNATHVHKLLANAELLSGQIIVFREMHALLSLILAGCPKDYENKHPCQWVQERLKAHDVFSLLTRRIYMSLLSSFSPLGLEENKKIRDRQIDGINQLVGILPKTSRARKAAKHISGSHPSTDVGVPRLVGKNGCITKLDPCLEGLPAEFYEKWNATNLQTEGNEDAMFTDLERACVDAWSELEECVEEASEPSKAHAALKRWSSNFTLHFGIMRNALTAWEEPLVDCKMLTDTLSLDQGDLSKENRKIAAKAQSQIRNVLSTISQGKAEDSVRLSKNVTLAGRWVALNLKPTVVSSEGSGSNSLTIQYRPRHGTPERVVLPTHIYLWLKLLATRRLDPRCFPQEMLVGALDARVRAASKCGYAFERDDIELYIKGKNEKTFKLTFFENVIDVEEQQDGAVENE